MGLRNSSQRGARASIQAIESDMEEKVEQHTNGVYLIPSDNTRDPSDHHHDEDAKKWKTLAQIKAKLQYSNTMFECTIGEFHDKIRQLPSNGEAAKFCLRLVNDVLMPVSAACTGALALSVGSGGALDQSLKITSCLVVLGVVSDIAGEYYRQPEDELIKRARFCLAPESRRWF